MAGWALAQAPVFLRDLTIERSAAPRDTLIAVIVAVLAGGAILFPSLALLFRLVLPGTLDHKQTAPTPTRAERAVISASARGLLARLAVPCLLAGVGLTTIAEAARAHAVGVTSLLGFIALGFPAALSPDILRSGRSERSTGR